LRRRTDDEDDDDDDDDDAVVVVVVTRESAERFVIGSAGTLSFPLRPEDQPQEHTTVRQRNGCITAGITFSSLFLTSGLG
jgi:hypothetical protein